MQPDNQLRISLGLAIAEGRLHPDASRDLFIFLDCYEYQDTPVLPDSTVQSLLAYHRRKHEAKMAESCPFISGNDQFPWVWPATVQRVSISLSCNFSAEEQLLIVQRLDGKI